MNNRVVVYIRWLYMQYLLNTALYMLEPLEVRAFNFILLVILATWAYSTYIFFPSQIMKIYRVFTSNESFEMWF
jgi:hypothetical protein